MAQWDSADCLARFRRYQKRPSTDEALPDAAAYALLQEAQVECFTDIAPRAPTALMGAPTALTTADNITFTFGTDSDSNQVMPFGHAEVYTQLLGGRELYASTWADREGDFIIEGATVRMVGNVAWSTSTLYGRWVALPLQLNASVAPVLKPVQFRDLIVYKALEKWCAIGGERDDGQWEEKYNKLLMKYLLMYKTSMKSKNAPAGLGYWRSWWTTLAGLGGQVSGNDSDVYLP